MKPLWAARQFYEAADYAALRVLPDLDLNSPDAENRLLAHPLVQATLLAISADLETVETSNLALVEELDDLRNGAYEAGVVWMNAIP